jgi:hypothetical protein
MTARETGAVDLKPVDMVLFCPKCGLQHVDAPTPDWTNPPHRSHLCHECGCVWRPADVPTNGVAFIQTCGVADTVFYNRAALTRPQSTPSATGEIVEGFWLVLREPGRVPERKGPWPKGQEVAILREFIAARPTSYTDILTLNCFGHPQVDHGPEVLQMLDGRSMTAGAKHNERARKAHEAHHGIAEQQATTIAELREAIAETLDKDFGFWSSPTQAERRARLYGAWKNSAALERTRGQ